MFASSGLTNLILDGISPRPVPAGRFISRMGGLAFIGLSWVGCAGAAQAQSLFDRSENVTVAARPRPEYDPLGLRIGAGFLVYPEVTLGETLDDNVFELPSSDLLDVLAQQLPDPQRFTRFTDKMRPLTDATLSIEPSITIKSNWNQHSLKLTANTTIDRSAEYPDFSADFPGPSHTPFGNSEQYNVAADGTLNVRHDLTVNVDASYGRQLLPRTFDGYVIVSSAPHALGVMASFSPLFENIADAKVEIVKDFARFRFTVSGEFQNYDYTDGFGPTFNFNYGSTLQPNPAKSSLTVGPIDQTFHNHDSPIEYLRGDYALSTDVALFAEETTTETRYPNGLFQNRFSSETLVGVNFQVFSLITAEIGVGNLYDVVYSHGLKPVDTPDARLNLTYFP
ncbi:MAG TPA: outer membrane beta-barrel protein, partial [Caulobacteraceae bacterium]|nr:outer membrane beta-barrel protein [Caulobacteraceae bacterium]